MNKQSKNGTMCQLPPKTGTTHIVQIKTSIKQ